MSGLIAFTFAQTWVSNVSHNTCMRTALSKIVLQYRNPFVIMTTAPCWFFHFLSSSGAGSGLFHFEVAVAVAVGVCDVAVGDVVGPLGQVSLLADDDDIVTKKTTLLMPPLIFQQLDNEIFGPHLRSTEASKDIWYSSVRAAKCLKILYYNLILGCC